MAANPFDEIEQKLETLTGMVAELSRQMHHIRPADNDKPLDVDEAANYLSIPKSTIYKFTHLRLIPHFKKGKRIYFYRQDLDKWLQESRKKTVAEIEAEA